MYDRIAIDDVEPRDIEGIEPALLPIGLELKPERMRPSVWHYDAGEKNEYHRQGEQEELYVVLDGALEATIERDDREVVELTTGDVLVVPPESWRQLEAIEESRVLVVGAPNVKDDAIHEE
ncbi:cupin domain-containing protein [Halosolutus gelatinilyticus]|uniref:cupin domain-containing protein n=1 Tax=Halosolutus gelatinilyticus TaxID=2931975 RepID=UPI001FF3A330|nr:cupin domain-containing protein [Halosolutus gelatinilyticus]